MSKADALELTEFIDPQHVTYTPEELPDGDFGDISAGDVAIVLSAMALKGLIAYLVFRHRGKSFEETLEIEKPDGTRVRRVLKWRDTSGEPADATLAAELATLSGFPLDELTSNAR